MMIGLAVARTLQLSRTFHWASIDASFLRQIVFTGLADLILTLSFQLIIDLVQVNWKKSTNHLRADCLNLMNCFSLAIGRG